MPSELSIIRNECMMKGPFIPDDGYLSGYFSHFDENITILTSTSSIYLLLIYTLQLVRMKYLYDTFVYLSLSLSQSINLD